MSTTIFLDIILDKEGMEKIAEVLANDHIPPGILQKSGG